MHIFVQNGHPIRIACRHGNEWDDQCGQYTNHGRAGEGLGRFPSLQEEGKGGRVVIRLVVMVMAVVMMVVVVVVVSLLVLCMRVGANQRDQDAKGGEPSNDPIPHPCLIPNRRRMLGTRYANPLTRNQKGCAASQT